MSAGTPDTILNTIVQPVGKNVLTLISCSDIGVPLSLGYTSWHRNTRIPGIYIMVYEYRFPWDIHHDIGAPLSLGYTSWHRSTPFSYDMMYIPGIGVLLYHDVYPRERGTPMSWCISQGKGYSYVMMYDYPSSWDLHHDLGLLLSLRFSSRHTTLPLSLG